MSELAAPAAGQVQAQAGQVPPRPPLWKQLAPFAVAAGLIAVVLWRMDLHAFVRHLASTNYAALLGFAAAFSAALLLADSAASALTYRMVLGPVRLRDFMTVRGASYLPGLINHHVGQAWLTFFLSRAYGARIWGVAGATLLVYATTFACVALLGGVSVALEPWRFSWLPVTLAAIAMAGVIYLTAIRRRPQFLLKRQLLRPLFEAGVSGQLLATAARLPHVVVLFFGAWIPFMFFGVHIPFVDALALLPPMLILVALPITPQGLGTRDAYAAAFFSSFAPGAAAEQRAAVAATTLTWAVALTLVQIVISLSLLARAQRLRQ